VHETEIISEGMRISIIQDIFRPAQELENAVNLIWENAIVKQNFHLTNSKVLRFIEKLNNNIIAQVCEYKYFYAQSKQPNLFASLNITILAVSGITICGNGIVVGKRSINSLQDAGYWELTPSGSIGAPDLSLKIDTDYAKDQVIIELEEEIGILPREIGNISLIGYLRDTEAHVIDLLFLIKTSISRKELYSRSLNTINDEYTEIHIIDLRLVSLFLWFKGKRVVASSHALLRIYNQYLGN